MRLLGLDPGLTSTGWGLLENGRVTDHYGVILSEKWRDKKKQEEVPTRERIDDISLQIHRLLVDHKPDVVVMEDFVFFGNRGRVTSIMPALIESIRILCRTLGVDCEIYANGTWKRILLKNHQANKNQVQHFIHRKLQLDTEQWDHLDRGGHIRDSYALAYTHWLVVEGRGKKNAVPLRRDQRPVFQ